MNKTNQNRVSCIYRRQFVGLAGALLWGAVGVLPRAHADFLDAQSPAPTSVPALPTAPSKTPPATPLPSPLATEEPVGQPVPATPIVTPKSEPRSKSAPSKEKKEGILSPDLREHDTQAPIQLVNGDSLEGSMKSGLMVLKGNVALKQADTQIWADVCELYSTPGNQQPARVLAKGNVRLQKSPRAAQNQLKAKAEEVDYDVKTGKVLLKGSPKVWRGEEVIQGEIIEVDLNTQGVSVKKASALLSPPEKEK